MSRVTIHYCDFSTQVPSHIAQFSLSLREENKEEVGFDRQDSCLEHLCAMSEMWFRTSDDVRELHIRRLPDTVLPPPGAHKNGSGRGENGKYPCRAPGCERSFAGSGGRTPHEIKMHPEWAAVFHADKVGAG